MFSAKRWRSGKVKWLQCCHCALPVANVVAPAAMQTATRKALVALSCITACSSVLLASTQHPLDPLELPVVQATPQTPSPSLSPSLFDTLARKRLFQSGSPAEPHIPNRTPLCCWGLLGALPPVQPASLRSWRQSSNAAAALLSSLVLCTAGKGQTIKLSTTATALPAGASTSRAVRQCNGRSHSGRREIGGFTVGDFCTTFWIKLLKKRKKAAHGSLRHEASVQHSFRMLKLRGAESSVLRMPICYGMWNMEYGIRVPP